MENTLAAVLGRIIFPGEGILHYGEGVDLLLANIELSGMEQLIYTISNVKWKINPRLEIASILITMADIRANCSWGDRGAAPKHLWR